MVPMLLLADDLLPAEQLGRPEVHSMSTDRDASVTLTGSQLDTSSRGPNAGFRHTSGLRVGVIEVRAARAHWGACC
jgi:hypothetical protein